MRKVIVAAVVIIALAAVGGFTFFLYKVGESMMQFRCGCSRNDRGQI